MLGKRAVMGVVRRLREGTGWGGPGGVSPGCAMGSYPGSALECRFWECHLPREQINVREQTKDLFFF